MRLTVVTAGVRYCPGLVVGVTRAPDATPLMTIDEAIAAFEQANEIRNYQPPSS